MKEVYDLFLLMMNLSQIKERERLVSIYKESMENIFPGIELKFSKDSSGEIPLETIQGRLGSLYIKGGEAQSSTHQSLIRNTASLLSIILENLDMNEELTKKEEIAQRDKDKAELLTKRFFDLSPDLLCIATMEGYFYNINKNWSKLLGWSTEELMSRPHRDFVHEDDIKSTAEASKKLHEGEMIIKYQNRYRCKDGRYKWLSWNSSPLIEEGLIFAVARDITEEKENIEKKIQQEKLQSLGQLAGGIAHDFNNQLSGILGFAELAKEELPNDSAVQDYLENIIHSVEHSKSLTYQLLSFARKGKTKRHWIDLHDLVKEVIEIIKRTSDPKITLTYNIQKNHRKILADSSQLHNALLNLAINARDALSSGGEISISTRDLDEQEKSMIEAQSKEPLGKDLFCLEVRDNGKGIDEEDREHVFEPFYSTKKMGTGIGLAAVYGTIKAHMGHIDFTSSSHGTCFKVYLPRNPGIF